jgi:drug/metabolite transporter (DMT)-like permease
MIKNKNYSWIVLLFGVVCISVSAIFVKKANVNGISAAFFRVFFAILFILPFYIRTKKKNMRYKDIIFSLLGGMFFAFELVFWNIAVIVSNATFPTLLVNLSSVWVGIGALILFREKLTLTHWVGNIIALLGVAVLIGINNIINLKVDKGFIFSIIASIFLALYILSVKQARFKNSTLQVVFFTLLGSVITLLICCIITGSKLYGFSSESWIYLLCLGLITQVGGYFSINYSLGYLNSSKVSIFTLIQPVLTAIFAIILLNESFAINHIIGGIIILAGLFIAIVKFKILEA